MKISTNYINRKTLIFIVIAVMCIVLLMPAVVAGSEHEYVSLSPLPGIESVNTSEPGAYFSTLFTLFIAVISILAVIKLMLCGFQYMTSEAISSKENAKKCIWAVIFGIFLILLSYLILSTINEDLTKLNFDKIKEKIQEAAEGGGNGGGVVITDPPIVSDTTPVDSVVHCTSSVSNNSCRIDVDDPNINDRENCNNADCRVIDILSSSVCDCEGSPPPSQLTCYDTANGTASFDSMTSCNVARNTELADLDSQLAQTDTFINLENSYTGIQCFACTIGTSGPYCYEILDLSTGTTKLSTSFEDKGPCDIAHDDASKKIKNSLADTFQNLTDSINSISVSTCSFNDTCP